MLTRLEDAIERLCRLLILVVGLSIILMMVAVSADVVAKYVFNSPVYGTSEMVGNYFMIAIVFLSIPIVELYNKAIYVDLFYNLMPRPAKVACLILVYVAQIAFFGVLGYQSWFDSIEAYEKREVVEGVVDIIIWPSRFFLLVGFVLAFVISLLRLLQILTSHPAVEPLLTATEPHIEEEI